MEAEGLLQVPFTPDDCASNYQMFYLVLPDAETRAGLLAHLKAAGIHAVFHYVPLHTSPMGAKFGYQPGDLPVTEDLAERLVRLPFYHELAEAEQLDVVGAVAEFLRR